ncbi:MAG: guanylate cyclase [Verrucomicrobia bacterium]|nr:MAG: guanylate cyclase [Verrucomicrobiota bacterium]
MSSDGQGSASPPDGADDNRGEKSESEGNLKHELRTPLSHIIGYCEMLMEQAQDDGLDIFITDLDRIHSAGERLLDVVDELCDPAAHRKIDEVAMNHEVRTPLNQVIGYAEMLQEQAKDLGHDSFASDLQNVHTAGRRLLELIVENFASIQVNPDAVGSEFITSKRQQAFAKETTAKQNKAVGAAIATASLLVVDDNELNRDMLTRRLERLGYKVSCAENGIEALKLLRTQSFDLLLLDIIMPVMDGFEVLEQLKADPLLRDIPVVVLSASDQLDHVVKCIQKGAQDYLSKPFSPVLLQARIGSCLERKGLRDQETLYLRQIEEEKQRSDELLHVILPRDIAAELKATDAVKPRRFERVGILFCDIVGFTAYSARRGPEEILSHLQTLVEAFEQLCLKHDLEKIKTIGDSFMATAGLMQRLDNPALNCVRCGLDMVAAARELPTRWQVRVGVHVGPVIAGVVGHRKYQYDVWGDAVNTASRMEQAAAPGSVCVNKDTWNLVAERCSGRSLGRIELKGKGEQELFVVNAVSN